jgi:hypothetical protein
VYKRKVDEASRYRVELQAAVADSEKEVINMCTELGEQYEPVRLHHADIYYIILYSVLVGK